MKAQRFAGLVAAVCALTLLTVAGAHAAGPTPTPASLQPPANPSDVRWDFASRTISWHDNSTDETGFSIIYTIGSDNAGHSHDVDANVTSLLVPEDVNETDRRIAHIVINAFNSAGMSSGAVAEWLDATPSPNGAGQPTPVPIALGVDNTGTLTWHSVRDASTYHLHGSLETMRVNAARPFCAPPAELGSMTVDIDVSLAADATSYAPTFPQTSPDDRWFVYGGSVQIEALDAAGALLAGSGVGIVAETVCSFDAISAPTTGVPPGEADITRLVTLAAIVSALAGAAMVALGVRRVAAGR